MVCASRNPCFRCSPSQKKGKRSVCPRPPGSSAFTGPASRSYRSARGRRRRQSGEGRSAGETLRESAPRTLTKLGMIEATACTALLLEDQEGLVGGRVPRQHHKLRGRNHVDQTCPAPIHIPPSFSIYVG